MTKTAVRHPAPLAAIAAAALLAVAALAGCTWVDLTNEGRGVRVASAAEVEGCERLGATHSKTSDTVWIFARSDAKVKSELESLARNEAAAMGGDAIVPTGPVSEGGRRSFDVYRCGP